MARHYGTTLVSVSIAAAVAAVSLASATGNPRGASIREVLRNHPQQLHCGGLSRLLALRQVVLEVALEAVAAQAEISCTRAADDGERRQRELQVGSF